MTSAAPRVNGARLLARLTELARIGGTAEGGVSRPAYGAADVEARETVRAWMREAGLSPVIDAAGNTIARRTGDDGNAASIMIGSHTDSVPDGGRFDGALGLLAAIEVAQTVAERGIALRHPLEVVNFQNEEGGIIGSRAMAGRLTSADLDLVAVSGFTIRDGIRALGGEPDCLTKARRAAGSIAAYIELHIEQGTVLEELGAQIGVVEGIVGIRYWEVTVDGEARHAGTTPMTSRHDALLTASRFVELVHDVVTSEPGAQVGTVGRLSVHPGAPNVVPGRVMLTLELRDIEEAKIERLYQRIAGEQFRLAERNGTSITLRPTHSVVPAPTDARLRAAIASAATALDLRSHPMPSGAGHDAQNMTVLGPSAMLFVPSVAGVSHSPYELTVDEDVVNGANVLLGAVTRVD